jgi:Fur family ferric uptake transcriptional regulator
MVSASVATIVMGYRVGLPDLTRADFRLIIETESQFLSEAVVHAAGHLAQYLAKKKLKMTRGRRAVLEMVLALRGHFDVDEIRALLNRSGLAVSRATLYRTLPVLVEAGLVHKIEMERGQTRYEPIFGRHHHDHMVCLGCGGIAEFENREIERLQEEICRRKKFRMTGHTHQVRGFCARCERDAPGVRRRADDLLIDPRPEDARRRSAAPRDGSQRRRRPAAQSRPGAHV